MDHGAQGCGFIHIPMTNCPNIAYPCDKLWPKMPFTFITTSIFNKHNLNVILLLVSCSCQLSYIMTVDDFLEPRYIAIEIWYSPGTRTVFAAKWRSVSPKSLKFNSSISLKPGWSIVSYMKKMSMTRLTPKLHPNCPLLYPPILWNAISPW